MDIFYSDFSCNVGFNYPRNILKHMDKKGDKGCNLKTYGGTDGGASQVGWRCLMKLHLLKVIKINTN